MEPTRIQTQGSLQKRQMPIGGKIRGHKTHLNPQTKDEEPMEFISFEDTSALYETTFFPQTYARFCHILNRSRPYVLTGLVEEDFGAVTLTVDSVRLL